MNRKQPQTTTTPLLGSPQPPETSFQQRSSPDVTGRHVIVTFFAFAISAGWAWLQEYNDTSLVILIALFFLGIAVWAVTSIAFGNDIALQIGNAGKVPRTIQHVGISMIFFAMLYLVPPLIVGSIYSADDIDKSRFAMSITAKVFASLFAISFAYCLVRWLAGKKVAI